jgi:hypothetical protein
MGDARSTEGKAIMGNFFDFSGKVALVTGAAAGMD